MRVLQRWSGVVALFLVVAGGSAWAVDQLSRNEVRSKNIARGAVKKSDIGKEAVNTAKVKNSTLLSEDFAPGELPAPVQGLTLTMRTASFTCPKPSAMVFCFPPDEVPAVVASCEPGEYATGGSASQGGSRPVGGETPSGWQLSENVSVAGGETVTVYAVCAR
jgi:hypothetical protein